MDVHGTYQLQTSGLETILVIGVISSRMNLEVELIDRGLFGGIISWNSVCRYVPV